MVTYYSIKQLAEQANFSALLNSYCRELTNWNHYQGVPEFDKTLAAYLNTSSYDLHIRFDFSKLNIEVFAPTNYLAETGIHSFGFPIVERDLTYNIVKEINPQRFLELTTLYAKNQYPDLDAKVTISRIENSIENIILFLDYCKDKNKTANELNMSFIQAEQSLVLGHNVHPLPKARIGFTADELFEYSPETAGHFQLHYFLINPENVTEKTTESILPTDLLRTELLEYIKDDRDVANLLLDNPGWKVMLVHPWEAKHLLKQPELKEMQAKGLLHNIGARGPLFTPTASIRTVYNERSDRMYKFSLHIKITNSERIMMVRELYRGYHSNCLFKTELGTVIKNKYPKIEFIADPAFIFVSLNGKPISGFNVSFRDNPFKNEDAKRNVTLLAALCQNGLLGQPSRIFNLITEASNKLNKPVKEISISWFEKYLELAVKPFVEIFDKYGISCEPHQQNVLLELDRDMFPSKLYYRDNQDTFFRKSKEKELIAQFPELDREAILPDRWLSEIYTYYLLINNVYGIIHALGREKFVDERTLIDRTYVTLKKLSQNDVPGIIDYILDNPNWLVKCNMLTSLHNMDEASSPMDTPIIYVAQPNNLNSTFYSGELLNPLHTSVVYSRYFEKKDVTIMLRPFDIEKDLEMVHEWFNREHAKDIWRMDWPIQQLETYYRTLLPSKIWHSYIGEIDGNPTFNFEIYLATRDIVGKYYDVLPSDYGIHLLIVPTDPKMKFSSASTQTIMDWIFSHPQVGRCITEGAVESLSSLMNLAAVGFRPQGVISLPTKNAMLTFCYREWYWEVFPKNKTKIQQA